MDEKEIYYIKKYNSANPNFGYNISKGGNLSIFSKLTKIQVNEIKKLLKNSNMSINEIADLYNIDCGNISDINTGDTWYDDNIKYPIRISNTARKLTRKEVFDIYNLIRNGIPFSDIAYKYNCSTTLINYINIGKENKLLGDSSYPIIKRCTLKPKELIEQIIDLLLNTNLSQRKIANKLNIDRETVARANKGIYAQQFDFGDIEFPIRK